MATDNALRSQAVPFFGQVLGYNHSENSEQDVSSTYSDPSGLAPGTNASLLGIGDLQALAGGTSQANYMIRILRPTFGQIVEAYLNFTITLSAADLERQLWLSCGSGFDTDGMTPLVPTFSFIQQCHQTITGRDPSFGLFLAAGTAFTKYKLPITSLIPQVGSANYNPDFFTVGFHFDQSPTQSGAYHLSKFFITGSALVSL